MRLSLLLPILFLSCLSTHSQNVSNPSFDSVYFGGIDRVFDWITSDVWALSGASDTVYPQQPNTHFEAMGLQYHEMFYTVLPEYNGASGSAGDVALALRTIPNLWQTNGAAFRGFVVNGNHFYTDSDGYIDLAKRYHTCCTLQRESQYRTT